MTMSKPDDLDPTFAWKPEFLAQLQHIADTDELQCYDGTPHLASTSASGSSPASASHPSGAYDWQVLKEAIKYRIRACLLEEFGPDATGSGERQLQLDLHPAAALLPWVQEGADVEVTWRRANMGLLCEEVEGENEGEGDAEGSSGVAAASEEAGTSAGAAAQPTADGAAAEYAQTNGTSDASPAAAAAADDDDASEDTAQYAYRARFRGHYTHPPFVHRADVQNFYPSKRPPSTTTTTTPLSAEQITTHTATLYTMLDDFDVQPPFTIQRLCELVVAPTAHYNTGAKWVAALKRCLSVTATRDAFPISPVQVAVGAVNGHTGGEEVAVSELDMDRMDGLPPASTRSRSSSVGSNAAVEPLFSPIPFIVRDENGQLAQGSAQQQTGEEGTGQAMEPIPDLELGGADRTHAMDSLPREVVDVAPTTAGTAAVEEGEKGGKDGDVQEGEPMQEDSPATTTAAGAASTVAAAVEATTSATSGTTTAAAAASEPLGLPDGAVDELDNPTNTVNPLTSTTSSTEAPAPAATAAPAAQSGEQQGETQQEAEEETGDPEDAQRSSKRRKSIASVHDE